MSNYSCDRCKKQFSQKYRFNSHKKRKTPCKIISNIDDLNLTNLILKKDDMSSTLNDENMKTYSQLSRILQLNNISNIKDLLEHITQVIILSTLLLK